MAASELALSWRTANCSSCEIAQPACRVCAQYATHVGQLQRSGDFVTKTVAGAPVLVCVDDAGKLRAFHNVRVRRVPLLTAQP